jgi:hypothetical protein
MDAFLNIQSLCTTPQAWFRRGDRWTNAGLKTQETVGRRDRVEVCDLAAAEILGGLVAAEVV